MIVPENSIASLVAKKISDFAEENQKNYLLDEISIYGLSEKDNSAIFTFEWHGTSCADKMAQEIVEFVNQLKKIIISMGKETIEQIYPEILFFGNEKSGLFQKVEYRFRIWPTDGEYEPFERRLLKA